MKKFFLVIFFILFAKAAVSYNSGIVLRHNNLCLHLFGNNEAKLYYDDLLYDEYTYERKKNYRNTGLDFIFFRSINYPDEEITLSVIDDPVAHGWFVESVNLKRYEPPFYLTKVKSVKAFKRYPDFSVLDGTYKNDNMVVEIKRSSKDKIEYQAYRKGSLISGLFLCNKGDITLFGRLSKDPKDTVRVEINDSMAEISAEYYLKIRPDDSIRFIKIDEDKSIECFEGSLYKEDLEREERGMELVEKAKL